MIKSDFFMFCFKTNQYFCFEFKTAKMNTKKIASTTLISIITAIIIFHFLILFKQIPYTIAWGGRLENDTQMYVFETISIIINLLIILVLMLKSNFIKNSFSAKYINGILWFFMLLFALNTIGNMLAKTDFEKYFAILTFISSVLIGLILKKEKTPKTHS